MRHRQRNALIAATLLLLLIGGVAEVARRMPLVLDRERVAPDVDASSRAVARSRPQVERRAESPRVAIRVDTAARRAELRRLDLRRSEGSESESPSAGGDENTAPSDGAGIFLAALPRTPLVHLDGVDAEAPRNLRAWRIEPGGAVELARGRSLPDGRLAFPPVVVPRDGLTVVVTPAHREPGPGDADAVRTAPPRDPHPPHVRAAGHRGGETLVRVTPREGSGAIVVADGGGEVFGRHPLPPTFSATQRVLELAIAPAAGETSVLVAHELADGRRSPWRPVSTLQGGPR